MRYSIISVEGYGLGLLLEESAYYARAEFHQSGHSWQVLLEPGEYTIVHEVNIGFEEIT